MLDHLSTPVSDFDRSAAFYDAALAPLGFARVMDHEVGDYRGAGYGAAGKPSFWIGAPVADAPAVVPLSGAHVAFAASSRAAVDAFHAAALAAGATDNGAPGLRPQYHPAYYAAFVIDPDGYHIEAVCHHPE